jgi:hypothetical protein
MKAAITFFPLGKVTPATNNRLERTGATPAAQFDCSAAL